MLPADMNSFLVGTLTASASFIGLLFVAISFGMNNEHDSMIEAKNKRLLAESSYAALLAIFFISLVGLVPKTSIGYVVLAMALTGLGNSRRLWLSGSGDAFSRGSTTVTALIYLGQAIYGITILVGGSAYTSRYSFMTLMIFLFAAALERAWQLTGIRGTTESRAKHRRHND